MITEISAMGMSATQDISVFSPTDRLGVGVFSSFLLHLVIILGVTFAVPSLRDFSGLPTLEITLVQTQSQRAPDNPEFLAQANQDGGGESEKPDIARTPLPVWELSENRQHIPVTRPSNIARSKAKQEKTRLLSQDQATRQVSHPEPVLEEREPAIARNSVGLLKRNELRNERARLNAEISRFWQEYQKRPRRKFLNARTQEYKYAAYMDAWRAKVERIGNLNYPENARRKGISGRLRLDVALNADGSVHAMTIRESSGHKLLDDAALRIVELAAPFAPFPRNIREETDILHITRTWKFNEHSLTSEN